MTTLLDIAVSVLIGLLVLASLSAAYWLVRGLDNEDAER